MQRHQSQQSLTEIQLNEQQLHATNSQQQSLTESQVSEQLNFESDDDASSQESDSADGQQTLMETLLNELQQHAADSEKLHDFIANQIEEHSRDLIDEDGNSFAHHAAMMTDSELVLKELVRSWGYKVLLRENNKQVTAVHLAAQYQSGESMQFICNVLADKNKEMHQLIMIMDDVDGDLPVHYAAMNESSDSALRFLVEHLENDHLQVCNLKQKTILHLCAQHQDGETMEFITQKASEIEAKTRSTYCKMKTSEGRTIAHYAAMNTRSDSALRWVVNELKVSCLTEQDGFDDTPVHCCCEFGTTTVMEYIISVWEPDTCDYSQLLGDNGNLPVHAAALNKDEPVLEFIIGIDEPQFSKTLIQKDEDGCTAVHLSAKHQTEQTMKLIMAKLGNDSFEYVVREMKNSEGRTVAHYAAMNERTESTLKFIVKTFGNSLLTECDDDGVTPIHCSALYQADVSCKFIMSELPDIKEHLLLKDKRCSESVVHYAAENEKSGSWLKQLVQCLDPKDFLKTNELGENALHLAAPLQSNKTMQFIDSKLGNKAKYDLAGHQSLTPLHHAAFNKFGPEVAQLFLSKLKRPDCLKETDEFGKNFFHFCTFNHEKGVQMFQMAAEALQLNPHETAMNFTDSNGHTPLHDACFNKNFLFLREFRETISSCSDVCTPLHCLLQDSTRFDYNNWKIYDLINCFHFMLEEEIPLRAEDSYHNTFLHAANTSISGVTAIIKEIFQDPLAYYPVQKGLINSKGLHVIHAFSERYKLDSDLLEELVKLTGKNKTTLLNLRVSAGDNKGATCLHFACAEGHKDNIEYLLTNKLSLSAPTESGLTCVDFACNKGKFDVLKKAATLQKVELTELISLIDPPKRALTLPDQRSAQALLNSVADKNLTSTVRKHTQERDMAISKKRDDCEYTPLLLRALELDSTEMLRSILALSPSLEIGAIEVSEEFKEKLDCKTLDKAAFPGYENLINESDQSDQTLLAIDLVLRCEKVNILSDIAVTAQFNLIPTCLTLLIHIKSQLYEQKGKHKQLEDLQNKLICVVNNAMDELYLNADEYMKKLIFRYLTADFGDGPLFAKDIADIFSGKENCRKYSVLELIGMLNSNEVFDNECMKGFIRYKWRELDWPSISCDRDIYLSSFSDCLLVEGMKCNCSLSYSLNTKFGVYFTFFFVFLIFFAWYITNYDRKNAIHNVLMWMYGYSLTLQEINDMVSKHNSVKVPVLIGSFNLPKYFADVFNYFDIIAIVCMWCGLRHTDNSHMFLSVSFFLFSLRSVSLLSYFKCIGPMVAMTKSLVTKDLWPFLILMNVVFLSFGVFFFNLLHPSSTSSTGSASGVEILESILTRPFQLAFGLYELESLKSCNDSAILANPNATRVSCADDDRLEWFNNFFVFVFLFLVSTVMWNLLIALFSLTVSDMAAKSFVIWKSNSYQMMCEVKEISHTPAPFSFLEYAVRISRNVRKIAAHYDSEFKTPNTYWTNPKNNPVPDGYTDFLYHQAMRLRNKRHTLPHHHSQRSGIEDAEASQLDLKKFVKDEIDKVDDRVAQLMQQMQQKQQKVSEQLAEALRLLKNQKMDESHQSEKTDSSDDIATELEI